MSIQHINAIHSGFVNDPFQEVASRLKGVIKRSNGGILAFCPSHEDDNRSLAVSIGRTGNVLVHCFAGCDIHEITSAIGLNPADLFVKTESQFDKQKRADAEQRTMHSMRISLLLSRLPALKHDLVRLLFVANSLHKNDAIPADDRQFIANLVIKLNDAMTFVEDVK